MYFFLKMELIRLYVCRVKQFSIIRFLYATEEEVVSNVYKPFENNDLSNDSCDMDIGCMHANENNTLPTGMDTEIMKSFVEIAKKTGQLSEIMELPPIDHDSPIRYVLSYT